jgi:hypothetical protein
VSDAKVEITGNITGLKYKVCLIEDLHSFEFSKFNINKVPSYFILNNKKSMFAVSKWVSPKRTRSYPYERVYNTLGFSKKITVIPIIKDEGKDGDRDFLQWDTVSLMSLLDVYVIFAYYSKASKNPKYADKITDFQFDNKYVKSKIKEIEQYHSSALHWNLNELTKNLQEIVGKAQKCYSILEKKLGVELHSKVGIEKFKEIISQDITKFMEFSRGKAKDAQQREILTQQPKEILSSDTKSKITITNYLGGKYYFTVDELIVNKDATYLIESKRSNLSKLPSKGDIKDGLLKMVLYSNICSLTINGKVTKIIAVLKLTSKNLIGQISSSDEDGKIVSFYESNRLSSTEHGFLNLLFKEAKTNNFVVKLGGVE